MPSWNPRSREDAWVAFHSSSPSLRGSSNCELDSVLGTLDARPMTANWPATPLWPPSQRGLRVPQIGCSLAVLAVNSWGAATVNVRDKSENPRNVVSGLCHNAISRDNPPYANERFRDENEVRIGLGSQREE